MPQYARPVADLVKGNWEDNANSSANIYQAIDESALSTADWARSTAAPSNDDFVVQLTSTIQDPLSSAGHILRYTIKKDSSGGAQIDAEVKLCINFVSTGSPGTVISSYSHTNLSASAWSSQAQTLSAAQADAITAYSSMALWFRANQV